MVCAGNVEPEKLPPTEDAARFHGYRVHLQIVEWKLLDDTMNLNHENWGWKVDNGTFTPIRTMKPVAPDNILKVIRCKCKSASINQCGTNLCSCRKNGLNCMSACGECHGESYFNKKVRMTL